MIEGYREGEGGIEDQLKLAYAEAEEGMPEIPGSFHVDSPQDAERFRATFGVDPMDYIRDKSVDDEGVA